MNKSITDHHRTTVCVVGGGPAGVVLGYLLARRGVEVMVLEAQYDFDRDFRGDTIHAAIMENLDQMGLAEALLELPHHKVQRLSAGASDDPSKRVTLVDFSRLRTKFPYVTLMAQPIFLGFMVEQAQKYPTFQILMGASAQKLVREDGKVCGVQYRGGGEWGEIRADLVVAADGRSSKIRRLAGLEPQPISEPMDVLWFRLPRLEKESHRSGSGLMAGGRTPLIILERQDHWQLGVVLPHGGYRTLRERGIEAFQERLISELPEFAERVREHLDEWRKMGVLIVQGSRLEKWYLPGLLLIGDAAHVMTPLGGVGINYAIQDAIVAANLLANPLKTRTVTLQQLAEVQKQREWPTKVMQFIQAQAQKRILTPAALTDDTFQLPPIMRLLPRIPILRNLPSKMIGLGLRRVTVEL